MTDPDPTGRPPDPPEIGGEAWLLEFLGSMPEPSAKDVRTAAGHVLDALSPLSRAPGESDAELRARVRAEFYGPRPGASDHMLATCRRFDEGAKLIELIGTVIVVVDFDKGERAAIEEALDHSRPAGVHFILTNDPMGSVKGMLDEARAEGARQERALSWWARARRWWGER